MVKNYETEKRKLKERLNKEIDKYFEEFERSSNAEEFNISRIEQLMQEQSSAVKKALANTNSELISNIDIIVKKNV